MLYNVIYIEDSISLSGFIPVFIPEVFIPVFSHIVGVDYYPTIIEVPHRAVEM